MEAETGVAVCVCRRFAGEREREPERGMGVAYEAAEDVEDGGCGCF